MFFVFLSSSFIESQINECWHLGLRITPISWRRERERDRLDRKMATREEHQVSSVEEGTFQASYLTTFLAAVCDAVEVGVRKVLGKKEAGGLLKQHSFLTGNFAPVPERGPESSLPVAGFLPQCLNGELVRVCPNPKFRPLGDYCWFDGDGMLHGVRIKNGAAAYVSRYVRTSKLKQEEYYGAAKFIKLGDVRGILGIILHGLYKLRLKLGILDNSDGDGTGNTALIYHNKRLLALQEGDQPYVVKVLEDGDLETIGHLDYAKKVKHPVTAHPKVDPLTGELFFYGYNMEQPYITYRSISKEGVLRKPVTITIPEPVFMHDFAITEHYAVFMDLPLYLRPQNLLKGKHYIEYDPTRNSRFGLLPRYAENELQIQWFELPPCFIFHIVNAWEEEDEVVLFACRIAIFDFEYLLEFNQSYKLVDELYEFRFNLKSGVATQKQLSKSSVDFPRINEKYVGRKHRYAYACIFQNISEIIGIVKFNLLEEPNISHEFKVGGNVDGVFWFGPERYASEAVFIPREDDEEALEDDGYLICFVYDKNARKSEVIVIDAKTMAPEPIGVVSLPCRVPYGFHAIFVNEEQLEAQR